MHPIVATRGSAGAASFKTGDTDTGAAKGVDVMPVVTRGLVMLGAMHYNDVGDDAASDEAVAKSIVGSMERQLGCYKQRRSPVACTFEEKGKKIERLGGRRLMRGHIRMRGQLVDA